MDFTEVIKFFNGSATFVHIKIGTCNLEMAEKHDVDDLLEIARNKLAQFIELSTP